MVTTASKPSLLWHRWFGVIGGVWLLLVALSGSVLVFYAELDRALNPELFAARTVSAAAPSVARAMAAAEAAFPGAQASYASLPKPGEAMIVALSDRPGQPSAVGAEGREVFVDPGTATVQGSRVWGEMGLSSAHIMPLLYKLHYTLLAGDTVAWLLGLVSLAWLIDHAISVPLALRSARRWGEAFRLRRHARGHKRVFDLHRAGAMWLLPVSATLAFSGVYFNLSDEFRAVLGVFSTPSPGVTDGRPDLPAPLYAPPVDADAALAAVGRPASGITYNAQTGHYVVHAHDARDLTADYGARMIAVDARSGRILAQQHFAEGSAADVVMGWQYPLHSGKAFGWTGRILILAAGLITSSLTITGYLIWWKKRRARRRSAPAVGPAPSVAALPAE